MDDTPGAAGRSLWSDQAAGRDRARPPLDADADVDVAIVGAGYTGLWTAYELLRRDASLRVLVIERDRVGFGASGRNGGWCVGELAGGLAGAIARSDRARGVALTRAAMDAVDEVGRVVAAEGIDCGFHRGGVVRVARTRPQLERQWHEVDDYDAHGFGDVLQPLTAAEAGARLGATKVLGGLWYSPGARVQPAHLVHGLADAVERVGATIVESTAVTEIVAATPAARATLRTDRGALVRADVVVRATEAYTRDLAGQRRALVPLYSLMIATEPLSADIWDQIGLGDRETFADDRRMVIYGQRTTDDRLAFGGRGAPYRYGSGIDPATEQRADVHDAIAATLVDLLPAVRAAEITHRWGGVLGVPRDWRPSVGFDRAAGTAWAGGYVGEGVAASNLAGRTLADLITGTASDLVELAWVGHVSPQWEPEPLRWAGINGARRLAAWTDRREAATQRTPRLAQLLDRLIG